MSLKKNETALAECLGYMGKVLWIDLGSEDPFHDIILSDKYYKQFLTGYGLAAKIIFDRQKPNVDPLGPDNILGIMSGLLTGTGALMSGRWMAVGKSPLTGTWGDANCGGHFSPEIKKTGYDGFFFIGKSKNPVYLLIDGEKRELMDARDIWGLDSNETEDKLTEIHGKDFKVACIGTAGEKEALLSGIVTDKGRLAARSGLGAVMGSKKLKAICIKGNVPIRIFDSAAISEASESYLQSVNDPNSGIERLRKYGTAGVVSWLAKMNDSPVKNWKGFAGKDFPPEKAGKISEEAVILYQKTKWGCADCPIICGGIMKVDEGPYPLEETHKPEYETLCAFGTMLLSDDVKGIIKINDILNRAGIDTISCGAVVAWAFEAYEQEVITSNDTDGLELTWGNSEAVVKLVEMIAEGKGIGDVLRDGIKCASKKYEKRSDIYAMNAGGQELPMHDPRLKDNGMDNLGLGVAFEAEPTPGRHTCSLGDVYRLYRESDIQARNDSTIKHPLGHSPKNVQGDAECGEDL